MIFCGALLGKIARSTAVGVIVNNGARRHLVPACSTSLVQFQQNHQRRRMSNNVSPQEGKWAESELKVEPEPKDEIHPLDAEKWTTVYKFRYINPLRLAVRLKMYQASICLFSTIALPFVNYFGVDLSPETMALIMGTNFYILLATVAIGHCAQQIVGILYINEPRDKVRVATLSFYGHRLDSMFDIEDIMQVSDQGNSSKHPYINLKRYSKPKANAFVYIGHGVMEKGLFEEIFGPVPQLTPQRLTRYGRKSP